MQRPSVPGGMRRVEKNGQAPSSILRSKTRMTVLLGNRAPRGRVGGRPYRLLPRERIPRLITDVTLRTFQILQRDLAALMCALHGDSLTDPVPFIPRMFPDGLIVPMRLSGQGPIAFFVSRGKLDSLLQSAVITVTLCAVGAGHTVGGRRNEKVFHPLCHIYPPFPVILELVSVGEC